MIAARILRLCRPTFIGTVVVLSAGACGDVQGPPDAVTPPQDSLSPAIISNPVVGTQPSPSSVSLSGSSTIGVVYVSLSPGSFPDGQHATIRNRATGAEATAAMKDGGFDPVPVAATAGDTLDFRIELARAEDPLAGEGSASEGEAVEFFSVVPPRRPPIVVRTDPPPKKRDVPLNATMLVVFSEPIDAARLTASSVQLLLDGEPVAGTVEFADETNLTATFTPAEPLIVDTEYTLLITQEIADLDGDALEAPVTVTFATLSGQPEAVVHVSLDPDAPPAGSTVVGSLAEAMTLVTPGGQVLVYDGTYPTENVIVDRPVTIEAAPGAAPLIQVVDLGGDGSQRTGFRLGVDSGSVTVRNLAFEIQEGYAAIYTDVGFDQLAIEGSSFTLGGDAAGLVISRPATPTAMATVRSSTFNGGMSGILVHSARVDVFESDFSDHGFSSIQYQSSATGRIEGNTITECGINGCINVVAAEQVEIVGNHLATTAERVTGYQSVTGTVRIGIAVSNGTHETFPPVTLALIENNIVEGLGGSAAFPEGAIRVSGAGSTEVTSRGNVVRVAGVGVALAGVGVIQGSDNRLELVDTAWVAHGGSLVDSYSDAVDYAVAVDGTAGVIDVRCNWWGSDAGPQNVLGSAGLTVSYTPWATQPVAGTGDRSCTP